MKTSARFRDPAEAIVDITLTGTLREFESLSDHLISDGPVPFYAVQPLIEQISDAASRLRNRVDVPVEAGEG